MKNKAIAQILSAFAKLKVVSKGIVIAACLAIQTVKLNATVPMLLRLDVSGNAMQNETVVYFDANGSFSYNSLTDAPSLGTAPGYLNIITRFDNIDYQTKCLPLLTQNTSIPIKIITGTSGIYQINANDISNLPMGACLMLHDNFTNNNQDLRTGPYTCTISDTESVVRFVLNIGISLISVSGSFLDPTCSSSANGYISAVGPAGTAPWNYYWKDSVNNIIKTTLAKTGADTLFGINAGAYKVDITSGASCTNGSFTYFLQGTQSPNALFTASSDTTDFSTPVFFTNNSINAGSYWWDFGDGMGANDTNTSHYYASQGTFTVTLTAIGSACGDSSFFTKKITVTAQTTSIKKALSENKNILISRDENGYYVKFNNTTTHGAIISVTDMLGQKINPDLAVNNVLDEKVYVVAKGNENRILIISVLTSVGEKQFKKVIN